MRATVSITPPLGASTRTRTRRITCYAVTRSPQPSPPAARCLARSCRRGQRPGTARRHIPRHPQGQYATIQSAVDAAQPGDTVLIAPVTTRRLRALRPPVETGPAGILITTPNITVRGINRNTVIVDGTTAGPACSDAPGDQNFGPADLGRPGRPERHRGVEGQQRHDREPDGLQLPRRRGGEAGNEIWWNGGAGSGGSAAGLSRGAT